MTGTETAISVAIRRDIENTIVLGAYSSRKGAEQMLFQDIEEQIEQVTGVSTDDQVTEAKRLIGDIIDGEPVAVSDLCELSWEVQTVALDAPLPN